MSGHYLKIEVTKYMCPLLRIFKIARSPPNPAIFTFKNIMQMTTYAFRFEFIGLTKYCTMRMSCILLKFAKIRWFWVDLNIETIVNCDILWNEQKMMTSSTINDEFVLSFLVLGIYICIWNIYINHNYILCVCMYNSTLWVFDQ